MNTLRQVEVGMITVYSTPACYQCKLTYRALEDAGLEYTVVDVTTSSAALEYVQDLGYSQAPVVVVEEQNHWAGFRPDLIKTLSNSTHEGVHA